MQSSFKIRDVIASRPIGPTSPMGA